jgi:hypothetical protein
MTLIFAITAMLVAGTAAAEAAPVAGALLSVFSATLAASPLAVSITSFALTMAAPCAGNLIAFALRGKRRVNG